MRKQAMIAIVSLSVGVGQAPAAFADGRDAIAGFILGMGVSALANSGKKKTTHRSSKQKSTAKKTPAQRGDAQVQAALNFYGFDAGTPDGVFGPSTRAAIKRYQVAVGQPESGTLTPAQTSALLTAFGRDSVTGQPGTIGTPSSGNGQMVTLLASLSVQDSLQGAGVISTSGSAAVQTEMNGPSVAALCETTATAPKASDAETLVGSYCAALGHAVNRSLRLTKALPSFDTTVSGKQCDDWLVANAAVVNAALAQPAEAAIVALGGVAPGADATQKLAMMDSFAICHGMAEAAGKPEDARAYAALVAAFGGGGYGELVAVGAALGLGSAQSGEVSADWYLWTAEALDGGSGKLIETPNYDHVPLLLALSESAKTNTLTWQTVLTQRSQPVAAAGLALPGLAPAAAQPVGLALPGLPAATVATEAVTIAAPALPANFAETYGMTPEAALTACRAGGEAIADLGRVTCRSLAASVGDPLLAEQYK